jgi:hypothetical protein
MPKSTSARSNNVERKHKHQSPHQQKRVTKYQESLEDDSHSLLTSITKAIDKYNTGKPLHKALIADTHEECIANMMHNIRVSNRTRSNLELLQYYHIGEVIDDCMKNKDAVYTRKKLGLEHKDWNIATFMFAAFHHRQAAIQFLEDVTIYKFKKVTGEKLQDCLAELKKIRPNPCPQENEESDDDRTVTDETYLTDLPDPDPLWNTWTEPDLPSGVVDAAEMLMQPVPDLGDFTTGVEETPFVWTQQHDEDLLTWLEQGDEF